MDDAFHSGLRAPHDDLIVWGDDASRLAYRESDLIEEAIGLERRLGLTSTRRAFPLTYP